jgi:beta-galactosidase/beta-glucuronidase
VVLPEGVKAVWDLDKAYRDNTPTRERVCINGLWRWQPAKGAADSVPTDGWGYFKVPGEWPKDARQGGSQILYPHPNWKDEKLGDVTSAWYQREITVPAEWTGRRVSLNLEYLNSFAAVYVDGKRTGEIRFPWGEVDLTSACPPGSKHVLSMLVIAMPLKAVMLSHNDTAAPKEVEGTVELRGLCGDVYLVGTPQGARISDVKVDTSVRKWEISFEAALQDLVADGQYALRAQVTDNGRSAGEFTSKAFKGADLKDGRIAFTEKWKPEKLWDTNTPQNMYQVSLSLVDSGGKVVDTALPTRFGFREFWIDGRDFYLNGARIYLSCMPLENSQMGAAQANYSAVRQTLERLKSMGINFVYTINYGCEPGTHLSFEEELRAADDEGVLVSFSQPHFAQYDWKAPDADRNNGYARHAAFYVHVAQNHPSVVFYSMSHNETGYAEAMNPDMIDGIQDPRSEYETSSIKPALRAEGIVKQMDPGRIVYHHSSGNLSSMHTHNFYPNFVPIQELSDWLEHWATVGVKPFFTCEYAAPSTLDWTTYRGWYKDGRLFASARVPWEFCFAEWNSQFLGDRAFKITEMEKANLRWEAKQFRAGNLWHRWDYPYEIGSRVFEDRHAVIAMYLTDNWRAFRTWGLSANSPWEQWHYWGLRDGVKKGRKEFKVAWDNLQRPGLSPDYTEQRPEAMEMNFDRSDWTPTADGQALLRNNMPLLAYIGGKPAAFTSKDHNFYPGETVEKQLIIINNSRETVTCDCAWSFGLPQAVTGGQKIALPTGEQDRIPLRLDLPVALPPGKYELKAAVKFSDGETQEDSFSINVLPRPAALQAGGKIALFDPKGETGKLLSAMGVRSQPVDANADLSTYDTLIVGKAALTLDGAAPDVARVRDGLKVIMFEQTSDVLEKRFGFRVEEYGLRQVFSRVPDHPLLAGLGEENLSNWRGEATIIPPRLKYELRPRYGPTVKWCDIRVPRVWRAGNRGNVASVLVEKPARGDFMPVLDGGFSLQFSPLMEYREGKGVVLFCQMDVTGRTEADPAAETLARNILQYVLSWKPAPRRKVLYVGDPAGKGHLEHAGLSAGTYGGGKLSTDQVLVVGSGGGQTLAASAPAVADFLKAGGNILAVGLGEQEANAFLPVKVGMKKAEHIAAYFPPSGKDSLLAGVCPADVHNRDPRDVPLVSAGATMIGDGVLATAENANVVFCQLAPYAFGKAQGAIASFVVNADDAVDGKQSALLTLGSTTEGGGHFGGQAKGLAGEVGKTYTFAVFVKGVGGPVLAHLEVERAGRPWDRAAKGEDVQVGTDAWTEVHLTFKVEKPFPQGWQAYISSAQDGAQFRADMFQLYEGEYVPWKAPAAGQKAAAPRNFFTNPSFEAGPEPWFFNFTEQYNLRRTYRRASFLMTRLLANMGAAGATPILDRFHSPVDTAKAEKRWLDGLYVDAPEEIDDPYRFFNW